MGSCVSTKHLSHSHHDRNDIGKVSSATEPLDGGILQSPKLDIFCLDELKKATSNFSQNVVIGECGFGSIYKGLIEQHSLKAASPETGTPISVSMLNRKGSQGQQEWLTEIKYLGQLHHPNMVKLIGYCLENDYRLLVYEFIPNGSLENHIFIGEGESHIQALSWDRRMKVALGAAEALAFLHNKVHVIHRDIKTSSILLDENYNAKLSGFGLARDGPAGSKSHISTRAVGTDYTAPEYIRTGHLNKKCDVYSFGIVLLEMISGRRAMQRYRLPEHLATWARDIRGRKDMFSQIVNPAILGQHATKNVIKVTKLTLKCVSEEPELRPDIEEVVRVLKEVQDFHGRERSRGSKHYNLSNNSTDNKEVFEFEFRPHGPSSSPVSI
ncbi:probable serine/threonine-protein kinase PBL10 [Mercurialis annua]|uniref:probable serine/threonine-protein kinase PBL10 n=1 Tax=Mercurialis annua TaxID=3986 RepID=UPI0024AEF800|nr:probable serine/threonine-protein kinase PBL10 [Mercurialis annua]